MTLRNKIIAGLTGLGLITASAVVGINEICLFDAEVINVLNDKVCFKTPADYKKYKKEVLSKYQKDGNNMWMWTDGENEEFFAVLNKEFKKTVFKKYPTLDEVIREFIK